MIFEKVSLMFANLIIKVFKSDIERLLGMDDLWKSRRKPQPLDHKSFTDLDKMEEPVHDLDWDQKPWSLAENVRVFKKR